MKNNYDKGKRLSVRLTEEEKITIQKFAKDDGLSISEYVKKMALKKVVISNRLEYTSDLRKLNFELGKIGNNVNQLAKHFNSNKIIPQDFKEFQKIMKDYFEHNGQIRDRLSQIYSKLAKL